MHFNFLNPESADHRIDRSTKYWRFFSARPGGQDWSLATETPWPPLLVGCMGIGSCNNARSESEISGVLEGNTNMYTYVFRERLWKDISLNKVQKRLASILSGVRSSLVRWTSWWRLHIQGPRLEARGLSALEFFLLRIFRIAKSEEVKQAKNMLNCWQMSPDNPPNLGMIQLQYVCTQGFYKTVVYEYPQIEEKCANSPVKAQARN